MRDLLSFFGLFRPNQQRLNFIHIIKISKGFNLFHFAILANIGNLHRGRRYNVHLFMSLDEK